MKTVVALSALQIAAIALLFLKVAGIEKGMNSIAPSVVEASTIPANLQPQTNKIESHCYPAEKQLRKIIGEELQVYLSPTSVPADAEQLVATSDSVDELVNQYQLESINQDVEYYKSLGVISDAQMATLQQGIAKLDETGRREMLGKLTRALNSGEIEGRL